MYAFYHIRYCGIAVLVVPSCVVLSKPIRTLLKQCHTVDRSTHVNSIHKKAHKCAKWMALSCVRHLILLWYIDHTNTYTHAHSHRWWSRIFTRPEQKKLIIPLLQGISQTQRQLKSRAQLISASQYLIGFDYDNILGLPQFITQKSKPKKKLFNFFDHFKRHVQF